MIRSWRLAPHTGSDHKGGSGVARTFVAQVCALGCMHAGALAAEVGVDELHALRRAAATGAYVPVQINLDVDVSLASTGRPTPTLSTQIRALEDAVLQPLGDMILPASVWRSGLGQIGAYVSAPGVDPEWSSWREAAFCAVSTKTPQGCFVKPFTMPAANWS